MIPIRTILHPMDFSGHAEYAFQLACCLARDQGARVIVLHVGEQPPTPPDHRKALEEQLRRVQAPDAKVRVEHRLEQGVAESEILRVARETNCDLIVMGTQGKMGIGRTVLPGRWVGSVAGKVLHSATCPVVMVKTPEADTPPS
jgi:nucleotide-binding universal stress UspA family protein